MEEAMQLVWNGFGLIKDKKNGRNNKGELKNQMLQIHMTMRNGLDEENWLQVKEDVQADFT